MMSQIENSLMIIARSFLSRLVVSTSAFSSRFDPSFGDLIFHIRSRLQYSFYELTVLLVKL